MNKPIPVVRKSPFFLISRLFWLELLLAGLYGLVSITVGAIFDSQQLRIIAFILFTLFEMVSVLLITLRWSGEYYIIGEEELLHRKGVIEISEESFSLKNVQAVSLSQTFLGRFFNYGTVKFFSPVLKQEYFLSEISDPKFAKDSIEKATGGFSNTVSAPSGMMIPIRNTK